MAPMTNILMLLNDLQNNKWHITAFPFTYKKVQYIVLFEDISNLPLNANNYVIFLTFIDRNNGNRLLQTKANEYKFSVNAREFREFFGINYAPNLGDIFKQFYAYFGNFVPTTRIQNYDTETQLAIIHRLNQNDHENVNNLCCYSVKRNGIHNGIQYRRTPFNSDKTKLLRENLYKMLGSDDTISFCYREDNPLSDIEIYHQFAQRNKIK